jgi:hypothetical protein
MVHVAAVILSICTFARPVIDQPGDQLPPPVISAFDLGCDLAQPVPNTFAILGDALKLFSELPRQSVPDVVYVPPRGGGHMGHGR